MADKDPKKKKGLPTFSKKVSSQLSSTDRSLTDRALALAESGQGPSFLVDASLIAAPEHASHGSHVSLQTWFDGLPGRCIHERNRAVPLACGDDRAIRTQRQGQGVGCPQRTADDERTAFSKDPAC